MSKLDEARMNLARLEAEERESAWAARACRACGEVDVEYGGCRGYLTSFEVAIARGEEGHSVIDSWLCEEHLVTITDALNDAGVSIHAHGGICFLEDMKCPGHVSMEDCPAPESQYAE